MVSLEPHFVCDSELLVLQYQYYQTACRQLAELGLGSQQPGWSLLGSLEGVKEL